MTVLMVPSALSRRLFGNGKFPLTRTNRRQIPKWRGRARRLPFVLAPRFRSPRACLPKMSLYIDIPFILKCRRLGKPRYSVDFKNTVNISNIWRDGVGGWRDRLEVRHLHTRMDGFIYVEGFRRKCLRLVPRKKWIRIFLPPDLRCMCDAIRRLF